MVIVHFKQCYLFTIQNTLTFRLPHNILRNNNFIVTVFKTILLCTHYTLHTTEFEKKT